jgi:hypothetical protein
LLAFPFDFGLTAHLSELSLSLFAMNTANYVKRFVGAVIL